MSPAGWLALSAAAALLLLPAPSLARTSSLTSAGRLGWAPPRTVDAAPSIVRRRGLVAFLVVFGLGVLTVAARAGPPLAVALLAVAGTVALLARDAIRARAVARRERALLTAIRVIAGELDAGASPAAALTAAAGGDADARLFLGVAAAAGDDAAAVLATSEAPALRRLAVAWQLAAGGGAALAEVVERVAADLNALDAARRAVAVAVAGPKSSAALLSGLPVLGIALGAAMGARPLDFLLGDPTGQVVCCVGVLLDAGGLLWLRRMIRGVQP